MDAKRRDFLEGTAVFLLGGIVVSLLSERVCTAGQYPDVATWWNEGRAQLSLDCYRGDSYEDLAPFWSDDFLGRAFGAASHFLAERTVAAWNYTMGGWYSPLVLGFLAALVTGLLYDFVKNLSIRPYRLWQGLPEPGSQNEAKR